MWYAKIPERDAEKARRLLSALCVFDRSRETVHSRSYVYFPVIDTDAKAKKLISKSGIEMVERRSAKRSVRIDYREALERILGKREREQLARGYELLGNIAIIELSDELKKKEKRIAQALMIANPRVKTVLAKAGGVYGMYRKRKLRYIAGARSYLADYRENNCTFRFDVRQVFFSSKLSFERSRVASLVDGKERVMVVGAGVGPFVVEIAKGHPKASVVGIEPNRHAYDAMKYNIKANKTQNAKAELGDVRKAYKKYAGYADRIIVPMPTVSLEFLDQIISIAKKKSIIHLYVFGSAESVLADSWKRVKAHAKANGYRTKMLGHRIVRPYSAKEVELVIDFLVDKIRRGQKRQI